MKQKTPRKKKTAAELEKERKEREAAWWDKVIVYYLNQMYHFQQDKEIERNLPTNMTDYMVEYMVECGTLDMLYKKEPGKLSAMEILEQMQSYQEKDSPFLQLYRDIKEAPGDEKKIAESVSRCVEEAPKRILGRGRRNAVHIRVKPGEKGEAPQEAQDPEQAEQDRQEKERLKYEMTFLRTVMPPQLYRKLCEGLVQQGRMKDPETEFREIPEAEKSGLSYDEYVAHHRTMPREEGGELNLDELYTSAAYMVAAWEQKDTPVFNERKADARAMELSGSKAFRHYMNEHPGSLLAAAQNTGLEATHADLMATDAAMKTRDNALRSTYEVMKRGASGQTAAYHQMMNALGRFTRLKNEPDQAEKDNLGMKLAQYVMTEGNPSSPHYRRENCLLAANAMKALLSEKDFQKFMDTVNEKRPPEEQITPEKLEALAARPENPAPEREGPVLVKPEGQL